MNAARKTCLFFILIGLMLPALGQQPTAETADWLVKGNLLIAEGRLEEAVKLFREQRQIEPLNPEVYFYSGMALAQMDQLRQAAADLMEAVRLDPQHPHYKILYANVITRLGNEEAGLEALGFFRNDSNVEPLASTWVWLLSDTYNRAGDNDSSLRILEILAKRHPENFLVDLNRGQIYWVQGDYEKAQALIESSIRKNPKPNPAAYFYKGKTLQQLGETQGAKEAYLEAVAQDPKNFEYLWKLGAACLALGENEEAIQYLEKAKPGVDEFPEINYVLGRAYQAAGDRAKARATLKDFQSTTKSGRTQEYKEIRGAETVGKGEDALDKGDVQEAIVQFERALQEDPDSWLAHAYLAEIFLAQGSLYKSYEHLERMEEIDPESASGQYLMARYWYQRRNYLQARIYAEKVREVRPSNSGLRNLLGNIYLAMGNIPEAVQEYSAAIEIDPDRPEFQRNLEAAKRRLP